MKLIPSLWEERGRASLALMGFVILEFFSIPRWKVFDTHVRLVDFWLFFIFLVAIVRSFLGPNKDKSKELFHPRWLDFSEGGFGWLVAMGLGGLLSLGGSQNLHRSAEEFVALVRDLFVFVLATYFMSVTNASGKKSILKIVVWMGVFQCLWSLLQFYGCWGDIWMDSMIRVSGTLGNELGHYLAACLAVGFSILSRFRKIARSYGTLLICSLTMVPLILGQYRTALMISGFAFLLVFFSSEHKVRFFNRGMLVVGMGGVLSLLLLVGAPNRRPVDSGVRGFVREARERKASTLHVRIILWRSALRMFCAHPLTGVGLGNFGRCFERPEYLTPEEKLRLEPFILSSEIDAHSECLTRLAETGLAGTVPFAAFLLYLFRVSLRMARRNNLSVTSLASSNLMLVGCVVALPAGTLGGRLFWMFAGMLVYEGHRP